MDVPELVALVHHFHQADRTEDVESWSSTENRLVLGTDWGDVEVVDSSDYNYDFCDTFDFMVGGRILVSVDISHVAPVFRLTGWGVRRKRQRTLNRQLRVAEQIVAKVRARLVAAGMGELSASVQQMLVKGIALELSGVEDVTLGKCLFKDYDGPPVKG